MGIYLCHGSIGVVAAIIFSLMFINFDQSWKKGVATLFTVILSGGGVAAIYRAFGEIDTNTIFVSITVLLVSFIISFILSMLLIAAIIKDKDDRDKIRIRDILLGQKAYIDNYYRKREQEITTGIVNTLQNKKQNVKGNGSFKNTVNSIDTAEILEIVDRYVVDCATLLYEKIQKNTNNRHTEIKDWHIIESHCERICVYLFGFIKKIATKGNKFSVSIIFKRVENGEAGYYMASRVSADRHIPRVFHNFITRDEASDYYYKELLENPNATSSVLATKQEIINNFANADQHYSQYIGVPICCAGNKKIALLQIIAYDDSVIFSSKDDLKKLTNDYFLPFSNLVLLSDKIENIMQ